MANKKMKVEKVTKAYMKGDLFDRSTIPAALKFFIGTCIMCVLFLIACIMMSLDNKLLNITLNLSVAICVYLFFSHYGMSAGADAVNHGEIMLSRAEKGRPVAAWEKSLCFHPLKGLVVGLIGSIPLFLLSLIFACITKRQMTGLGSLPSWVGGFENRPEVGNALAYYHDTVSMDLESILRMLIRTSVMPYVNMIGADNKDGLLMLERISPVLNLLPAVFYGLGYMNGVSIRTAVHTNIALGKKKQKKKQARERRVRQQNRGPEQLN